MMKIKHPARILIIDNDEINRFIATKLIQRISPSTLIDSCNNGLDALAMLNMWSQNNIVFPEFILLDLTMPIMDGWEFLDEFQKLYSDQAIAVVVLTSSIFRHDMNRAEKHAAIARFISKPLTMEHLENLFLNP